MFLVFEFELKPSNTLCLGHGKISNFSGCKTESFASTKILWIL